MNVKYLAFYLPQFHPIEINDQTWGKGFTEWTNVCKATPLFKGHRQPRVPGELGYYDLRKLDIYRKQEELARRYHIDGFCYYYYWFDGFNPMELPLKTILKNKDLTQPFCFCFANENWTRRWDGGNNEMILKQNYTPSNDEALIRSMMPFFSDERYIKIEGRPLLLVYKTLDFPNINATQERWRRLAQKEGFPDLYLCQCEIAKYNPGTTIPPAAANFDANYEFPPVMSHYQYQNFSNQYRTATQSAFKGSLISYFELMRHYITRSMNYPLHKGITLNWDNTSRLNNNSDIVIDFSIDHYENWLRLITLKTLRNESAHPLIFINAWNEWAEGTYLEPDSEHGLSYLEATLSAKNWAKEQFATPDKGASAYDKLRDRVLLEIEDKFLNTLTSKTPLLTK